MSRSFDPLTFVLLALPTTSFAIIHPVFLFPSFFNFLHFYIQYIVFPSFKSNPTLLKHPDVPYTQMCFFLNDYLKLTYKLVSRNPKIDFKTCKEKSLSLFLSLRERVAASSSVTCQPSRPDALELCYPSSPQPPPQPHQSVAPRSRCCSEPRRRRFGEAKDTPSEPLARPSSRPGRRLTSVFVALAHPSVRLSLGLISDHHGSPSLTTPTSRRRHRMRQPAPRLISEALIGRLPTL